MTFFKNTTLKYYLITFIVCSLVLFRPISDPDFGWHYKYGQYFVQNKVIKLTENIFSYNLEDYKWANSYWLAEVFFYTTYSIYPALPSIITSTLFVLLLLALLYKNKYPTAGILLSTALVTLIGTMFSISVRPMIFSSIFLLILVEILAHHKQYIKLLPLLFLIWANTHADFVLGIAIFGIYVLNQFVTETRACIRSKQYKEMMLQIIKISSWGMISLVITLINPYGIRLISTLFNETQSSQFKHISEWLPIFQTYTINNPLELFVIILTYSLIITATLAQRKKLGTWLLLSIILFIGLSIKSVYFSRIAIIISIYPVAMFWGNVATQIPRFIQIHNTRVIKLFSIYMYTVLFLATASLSFRTFSTYASDQSFCKFTTLPCNAIKYIKETQPTGNMFNNYNWGGYLIMNLPEYKTFIDGRMPSWKGKHSYIYDDYINITKYPKESYELFNSYAQEHNITWVFDYKESKLAKFLIETGAWESVYSDEVAIITVKK